MRGREMDVKRRFAVKASKPGEREVHTFTWGTSISDAAKRVVAHLMAEANVWCSWTFTVSDEQGAGEVTIDAANVIKAALAFAEHWGALIESLPGGYHCHMTCEEAESAAELFKALGDESTAVAILDEHGSFDEEGDRHFSESDD
jgi:hypothetical protein